MGEPFLTRKKPDSDHVTTVDCQQTSDTGFANHPGIWYLIIRCVYFIKCPPKYFSHPSLSNKLMNTQYPISTRMDTHDRKGSDITSSPDGVRYSQVSSRHCQSRHSLPLKYRGFKQGNTLPSLFKTWHISQSTMFIL
jgi:hypothetical protein